MPSISPSRRQPSIERDAASPALRQKPPRGPFRMPREDAHVRPAPPPLVHLQPADAIRRRNPSLVARGPCVILPEEIDHAAEAIQAAVGVRARAPGDGAD